MTLTDPRVSLIHVTVPPAPPACVLTNEPGENDDDCTTHDHVRLIDTEPVIKAGNRSVSHQWLVGSTTNEDGRPVRTLAVLRTMHTNSRFKGFFSTLNVITETDEELGGRKFTTQGYMPYDAITIHQEAVGRYSDRALAVAGANARAALMARKDDDDVRTVFGEL